MAKMREFPGELRTVLKEFPFRTKTGRAGVQRAHTYVLTAEQEAWLREVYPEWENSRIVKASGMKESTLHRFARSLGLTKSEKGLKGIMRRQAVKAKRINERSGYYDSLRGKAPGPAAVEGSRRMWQEVREGKRENPWAIFKRTKPHASRVLAKKRSEARKEMIRKERRRMELGLTRKTKLTIVVLSPYTRRQVAHRYSALKRGYILSADCSELGGERWVIWWDEGTERSERFERNLKKDGFKVERLREDRAQ